MRERRTMMRSVSSLFGKLWWAFALTWVACAPQHPFTWVENVAPVDLPIEASPLRPGDVIQVQIQNWEELRGGAQFTLNADGSIVLPLVGAFDVEGMTVQDIATKLDAKLQGIIDSPRARVSLVTPRTPVVTVMGEVQQPGRFEVHTDEGVLPALALAGGLTEFAKANAIYVVRTYPSRQRIRFRYSDLTGGIARAVDFKLRDGDVVVVE